MNFTSRISNLRLTSHDSSCSYVKYSLIDPKAQCIDGTRATFYLRSLPKSSTSKKKWHIHFEGGGWCYSLEHCEYRSTTLLGSSKNYPSCLDMKHLNASYFSSNKAHNPLLYDFNVVYVRYCDGGSFAGNKIHHYNEKKLYFMGKRIRQSLLDDLWNLHGMRQASDIVFSGASAGGLAVFLGIDDLHHYIKNHLRHDSQEIRIRGIPDSGFFPDYDSPYRSKGKKKITLNPNGPKQQHIRGRWYTDEYNPITHRNIYGSKMKVLYEFMGVGLPLDLIADADSSPLNQCIRLRPNPDECIFPQYLIKYITTPLFILQSFYDSWVTAHVLGVPLINHDDDEIINQFGQLMKESLLQSLSSSSLHSVFLDSCYHHTFVSWGFGYFVTVTDSHGVTLPSALLEWYENSCQSFPPPHGVVYLKEFSYPCPSCCLSQTKVKNVTSINIPHFARSTGNNDFSLTTSLILLCSIFFILILIRMRR